MELEQGSLTSGYGKPQLGFGLCVGYIRKLWTDVGFQHTSDNLGVI